MSAGPVRTLPCDACDDGRRGPGHIVCRRCWYRVPKDLRNDVWNTVGQRVAHLDAVQDVMEWLVAHPLERGE